MSDVCIQPVLDGQRLFVKAGLLEVERPDGLCLHVHELDDLGVLVGVDHPVSFGMGAKRTCRRYAFDLFQAQVIQFFALNRIVSKETR